MSIEYHFLKKAIENRNFVSFVHGQTHFDKIQPEKLFEQNGQTYLQTSEGRFLLKNLSKLQILKIRF